MIMATAAIFTVLAACVFSLTKGHGGQTCYATDSNPYLELGSKTSYEHAHNKKGIPPLPGCKAVQLWLVCRHGTRYPSEKNMKQLTDLDFVRDQIINNANNVSLCKQDLTNLKDWQFKVSKDDANQLTAQGRQDLYQLGHRFASYFPELLNTSYSPDKFIIRHSHTCRTKESAENLAKGVFGKDFKSPIPYTTEDDHFLRPYEFCDAWHKRDNKKEQKKFGETEIVKNMLNSISQRLGFVRDISVDKANAFYDMCRFNKAWNVKETSPWCGVFTKDDLKVMEYREDLKYYYMFGPGGPINLKLPCPLIRHMFNQFNAVEVNPKADHPKAFLYFGHENIVNMLSVRLGLTQNSLPLTADNYAEQQDRQFRTSRIVPFASNILAVLYKCSEKKGLKIAFYQSEHLMTFPGCNSGYCDWSIVKNSLAPLVQDSACTDDSYCTRHHEHHHHHRESSVNDRVTTDA